MDASVNTLAAARPAARSDSIAIPWFLYATIFGSASIVIGGIWDISWHRSIGRDTFWSPPHLAIYLGGVVAGLASAWVIFKTTFAGDPEERAAGVRIWGLRGPLGAFLCSWGAVAMLTSAPFDNWWHDAYGLDTKILSPPHVVLALGIIIIQLGAMITALALQNRHQSLTLALAPAAPGSGGRDEPGPRLRRLRIMFVFAAGIVLVAIYLTMLEYMGRWFMHSSIFYRIGCAAYPALLVAAARASGLRWPAAATAAVYMGTLALMLWVLPLFPAEPKLGPVRTQITHMVPLAFPLLLIAPALAVDVLIRRWGPGRDWLLSVWLGVAFFLVFLGAQWAFANFLISPLARNYVFGAHYLPYFMSADGPYRFRFLNWDGSDAALIKGLATAAGLAVVSSRIGLWWGNWMRRVQR